MAKEKIEEVNIFSKISELSDSFQTDDVQIVEGYNFNQYDRVKNSHLYYSSNFIEGGKGDRRFYNINKAPCKNESKNIDLDTKDINIIATNADDMTKAFLLKKFIVQWAKETNLGLKFNEVTDKLPIYGSCVAKRNYDGEIFNLVPLKNLENEPTACKLKECWTIEHFWFTPTELDKMKGIWDDEQIDMAIKEYQDYKKNYAGDEELTQNQVQKHFIHVVEYRDDFKENEILDSGSDKKYVRGRIIAALSNGNDSSGCILSKGILKPKDEYKEVHRDRQDGRWLGVGIVEDLEQAQMMKNEEMNYMRDALKLSSMILLQTRDQKVARNILTDLMNGDILRVQSEIQRVPLEVRNLAEKQQITSEIERLVANLSNSQEITTGSTLPSGTPFRLGALINENANKLFEYIREKVGLFYKEIFQDWVSEDLKKQMTKKNILRILGEREIKEVAKELAKHDVWNAVKQFILRNGQIPTREEVEEAEQLLLDRYEQNKGIYLEIPKDYFDFDYGVEFEFTGESVEKNTKLATLSTLLQMLGANPEMVNNPIFLEILKMTGLSSIEVANAVEKTQVPPEQPEQGMQPQQPQAPQMPVQMANMLSK